MMDVPFLPRELPVACSTFLSPSVCFWGAGEAFAEHPFLVQKSSHLFTPLLGSISFAGFTMISHYRTNTDSNLVIVHGKIIVVLLLFTSLLLFFLTEHF